jgi:hypothetical protein
VEKPHQNPRKGSASVALTSLARVAQAGYGNWSRSGTGNSGWWTMMSVPGFRMPARACPARR